MKKNIHPKYQKALFVDSTTGLKFVCATTIQTEEVEEFQGEKLPVVTVPLSAISHPLFVGGKQFVDTEGRVDKFRKRYEAVKAPQKAEKPALKAKEKQSVKPKKIKIPKEIKTETEVEEKNVEVTAEAKVKKAPRKKAKAE